MCRHRLHRSATDFARTCISPGAGSSSPTTSPSLAEANGASLESPLIAGLPVPQYNGSSGVSDRG
eukprot:12381403-Alexandrium_andersonii.AAC.1